MIYFGIILEYLGMDKVKAFAQIESAFNLISEDNNGYDVDSKKRKLQLKLKKWFPKAPDYKTPTKTIKKK